MNDPALWHLLIGAVFLISGSYYQFFILKYLAARRVNAVEAKKVAAHIPHFPKWAGWFLIGVGGIEIARSIFWASAF